MLINMHYAFSILFSLSFLHTFLCDTEEELRNNRTTLYISDGSFEINKTNVTYLNNKKPKNEQSLTGKVYYFTSRKDFQDIYKIAKMSQYFILLVDDSSLLPQLMTEGLVALHIEGIIIPNNTFFNSAYLNTFIFAGNYSVFMHNETNIDFFKSYDIRIEASNYFFHFSYIATIFVTPFVYLKTLSIISFLFSGGIIALWTILQKKTLPENIILVQKIFVFLPYLNIIIGGLMIIQMFLTTGSSSNSFLDSRIYVETALVTIRAIFRTIIWFLIILIASGWQIASNSLSRDKIKTFIKVYVFIYIVVCVDQIIDSFVGSIFTIFYLSEIKNIFFYLLMAIGIAYEGLKTLKLIQNKLVYASSLSPEFIPSLKLKKEMMTYHICYSIGYFVVYCILLLIHKVALAKYNTQDFLLLNYHVLDIILLSLYLILYRPRKLPPFFNVDFGEDEVLDFGEIYSSKIPNILDIINPKQRTMLNTVQIEQLKKDHSNNLILPLVVINPVIATKEDKDKKTINLIIENVSVGYLLQ